MKKIGSFVYSIIAIATAMIGYQINTNEGSYVPFLWSIIDFLFMPLAWIKWLICQEVNLTVIKHTFSFFLN